MKTFKPRFPNYTIQNVNDLFEKRQTYGQKLADTVANSVGSWQFIIVQSLLIAVWVTVNSMTTLHIWDPYPFILMNLVLSMEAAMTAPIIMMSQNRQAEKDRLENRVDYEVNLKAEMGVRDILAYLEQNHYQIETLLQDIRQMQEQLEEINSSKW